MKAGLGKAIITPRMSMWLAGYAHRDRPSEGTLCDLFGKTLCLEDEGGRRFFLTTTDLLGIPRSLSLKISTAVGRRFGVPRERLILTSSHTHSGPVLEGGLIDMYGLGNDQLDLVKEYSEQLVNHLLDTIEQAIADLEPCKVSWGIGKAEFAVNRREYTPKGIINGFNPIGPTDHDVPILRIDRVDGTRKALVFGYACHNTVLDLCQFSGDWTGFTQEFLEAEEPDCLALFVPGCAGDQNPYPRRSIDLARQHGRALADSVLRRIQMPMAEVKGPIEALFEEVSIPLCYPDVRKSLEAQLHGNDEFLCRLGGRLLENLKKRGETPSDYPYPIQVWRFSDGLQITALGGEPVVDYSLRLKHDLRQEKHFIMGYANDVMAYIPSLRILNEGGYEGDVSMIYYGFSGVWGGELERIILDTVVRMTEEIQHS